MSTMEVKYNSKSDAAHINSLATSKVALINSDNDNSNRVLCKNKARTGVLPICKQQGKKNPKYHGDQWYCILCKKVVILDCECKYHIYDNCFGKRSNQASVKDVLGLSLGNRADAVNNYQKTEIKW